MKAIASGAEAIIFKDSDRIIKKRIKKNYRIKEIDEQLRKFRTKREARIIEKIEKLSIKGPKLIKTDNFHIEMSFVPGFQLKNLLDKNIKLAKKIGEKTAILHNNSIIHGDLTTSNIIFNENDKDIYFIDFGLSFVSRRIEDKAVDIHLFKQALESKHYRVYKEAYEEFLKGYKKADNFKEIMERLRKVEERGRYKEKS